MKYIKGFDGLRAFSIIFVLLSHLGVHNYFNDSIFYKLRLAKLFNGVAGVQIFFVLSGFLITMILLNEKKLKGYISFKFFFIKRFLRLFPALIIFYFILLFLMKLQMIPGSKMGLIYSFFYFYNFIPLKYYTKELQHTWSLSVEEQFYLIWPFLIYYTNRYWKIIVTTLFIISSIVISIYIPGLTESSHNYSYYRWFLPAAGPILIGSLLTIIIHLYEDRVSKFFKSKLTIALAVIFYLFPLYMPLSFSEINLHIVPQSIGVAMLIVWIYYNQNNKIIDKLEFSPLRYIGKISYGLYIYQGIFLQIGSKSDLFIQKFPNNIIITIVLSILSYELIESKVLKLKKRFKHLD